MPIRLLLAAGATALLAACSYTSNPQPQPVVITAPPASSAPVYVQPGR